MANISTVVESPKFANNTMRYLFSGWQVSGIAVYNSGLPFTVTTSNFDPAGTGVINANPAARPNVTCDPNANAPHTQFQYFNTACFTTVTTSNFPGSAGRGIVHGPSTIRFDLTLSKNIRLSESVRLQFRAEAFNIFNHTNFRSIASLNTTSSLFGQIGAVRDPRTMQFGAKFSF